MDNLRWWLATRLTVVPVPYVIGRWNLAANLKWALIEAIIPPSRENWWQMTPSEQACYPEEGE